MQFILLKLEKLAIVKSVTFGKYEETHTWNLKKFKIYGGTTTNTQIELLDGYALLISLLVCVTPLRRRISIAQFVCVSGLNNDSSPETFILRHAIGGLPFPCRYIKIVPIQSWGYTYNFSIWFVELKGSADVEEVEKAAKWFDTVSVNHFIFLPPE